MTTSAKGSTAAVVAVAAIGSALLLDAAVETFVAGSALRWWVIGAAVLYAIATAVAWRLRFGWYGQLAIAVFVVPGLVAATAWSPGGLTDGVRLLGQSTMRVMAALAAAGVALAGLALVRVATIPLAARAAVGAIAAYGVFAFLVGAIESASLPVLLSGQSLWQRLPTVLQGAFIGAFIVLPVGLVWCIVKTGLRRPPDVSVRAELWKIVALATSFAIVVAGLPLRSGGARVSTSATSASQPENLAALLGIDPNAPKPTQEALNLQLANSLRAIEDGEREIARDHWDAGYLVQRLNYDPQLIFTWVQQNTFWIPYHGVLRGPLGVLMDRLGSSLDRAVLLAHLLQVTGQTVQLAHGSLSQEKAAETLKNLRVGRYQHAPASDGREFSGVAAVASQYQLDETSLTQTLTVQADLGARKRTQLLARVPEQTQRLAAAVGSPARDRTRQSVERVLETLRDHWWVRVQEGAEWRDFDLAAPAIGSALTTPTQTFEVDALPAELHHQVTVRVVAEQWANGGLTEHVALEGVLRGHEILGKPVFLRFLPSRWPGNFPPPDMSPEHGLRKFALDLHEWTPALVIDKESTTQSAVRDTGDLVSADEAKKASGGPVGGAMSGLTKKLDEAFGPSSPPAPEPKSDRTLTATWIEYEIQQPGERPRKVRRTVFDLIGSASRGSKSIPAPRLDESATVTRNLALVREIEILPIVCRFVPDLLTHLAAKSLLENREVLGTFVKGDTPDDFPHAQELAVRLAPLPTPLYGLALARFEWSRFADDIYVDQINVLTRHTFFAPAGKNLGRVVATDIVANDIGVDPRVRDTFAIRLEQGVLDTNAEAILASDRPNASNAGWAYGSSGSWTTVRTPSDPQLKSLRLSADVRKRIADVLASGYLVVAPTTPVTVGAGEFSGWWQVNPATGETLGMGSTGWGQEMVEYLVIVEAASLAFLFDYMQCTMPTTSNLPQPTWSRLYFVTPVHAAGSECLSSAIDTALFTLALGLIALPLAAVGVARGAGGGRGPGAGAGGGKPGPGGPGPTGPTNTQPLDPLPFDKTLPGGPGPGPGPAPPGPGPGSGPGGGTGSGTGPPAGAGAASGPGWLNWGESWPGAFSGPDSSFVPKPPPPGWNTPPPPSPYPPGYIPQLKGGQFYDPKTGSGTWLNPASPVHNPNTGSGVGGGGTPASPGVPPTQPGSTGTVVPGQPGPTGTLSAGEPGPSGTLPCSSMPCTTGIVKVHSGINGVLNALGKKGGG